MYNGKFNTAIADAACIYIYNIKIKKKENPNFNTIFFTSPNIPYCYDAIRLAEKYESDEQSKCKFKTYMNMTPSLRCYSYTFSLVKQKQ